MKTWNHVNLFRPMIVFPGRLLSIIAFVIVFLFLPVQVFSLLRPDIPAPGRAKAGKSVTNSIGMRFVLIPAGHFMMGSEESPESVIKNPAYSRAPGKAEWFVKEHPRHKVIISKSFYMQTQEVTVAQFRLFFEETGYKTDAEKAGYGFILDKNAQWVEKPGANWGDVGFPQEDNHPVVMVSWHDAQAFIAWLNKREGTTAYRLPTEAEWEYACRAGTKTRFYWGNQLKSGYANFADRSYETNHPADPYIYRDLDDGFPYTAPVGSFKPNRWGLYDMAGNVQEWCLDWYGDYSNEKATDPTGPQNGDKRVLRGGSWSLNAWTLRSAFRSWGVPPGAVSDQGFRVVKSY